MRAPRADLSEARYGGPSSAEFLRSLLESRASSHRFTSYTTQERGAQRGLTGFRRGLGRRPHWPPRASAELVELLAQLLRSRSRFFVCCAELAASDAHARTVAMIARLRRRKWSSTASFSSAAGLRSWAIIACATVACEPGAGLPFDVGVHVGVARVVRAAARLADRLVVPTRLAVALGGAADALVAGLVEERVGNEDERLDRDEHLQQRRRSAATLRPARPATCRGARGTPCRSCTGWG